MLTSNLFITGDNQRQTSTIRVAGISDEITDTQGRGQFVPTYACARWIFEDGEWVLGSLDVSGAARSGTACAELHRLLCVGGYPWVAELVERMRPNDPGADDLHIAYNRVLTARAELIVAEKAWLALAGAP